MWEPGRCEAWTLEGAALGLVLAGLALAGVPLAILLARRLARSRRAARRALVAVAVGLPLLFLLLWRALPGVFYGLTCKEGWIEALSPVLLLMAAVLFVRGALSGAMLRGAWAWAAMCLLVLLEELDWGQLILGFDTPGWVLRVSGRSDTLNFHNTEASTVVLVTGALALFLALPLAARSKRLAGMLRRWGLQPPAAPLAAAVLVVAFGINSLAMALGVDRQVQEVTEMCLALLMLGIALDWSWAGAAGGTGSSARPPAS